MLRLKSLTFIVFLIFIGITSYGQERKSNIGTSAPKLKIEKIYLSDGSVTTMDSAAGKLIVLDFWGTWCGPCIKSFSHMNDLVLEFKDQPVQFIALGYEDTKNAQKILNKHNVLAWRAMDTDLSTFVDYAAWSIPLVIIINQKGIVIAEMHPEEVTKQVIQDALNGKKIQDASEVGLPYFDPERTKKSFLRAAQRH